MLVTGPTGARVPKRPPLAMCGRSQSEFNLLGNGRSTFLQPASPGYVFNTPRSFSFGGGGLVAATLQRAHIKTWCGLRRSNCLFGVYLVLFVMYLAFGALCFAVLESPMERDLRISLKEARRSFMAAFPCVTDSALEELIGAIVEANNRGVSATHNVTGEPNWSFGQALFFSGTVVTTIGYGHVTPLSKGGKIFCIGYALLGIPLTLILLTACVERLIVPTTTFLQYLNSKLGHLYQPFHIRLIHLVIIASVLIAVFLLIPAAIFDYVEPSWDYLDSLYYCFISMTTIGLGDYIPGDTPHQKFRPLYKVITTVYLLTGLTFMMLSLRIFYDIPQLNFGIIFLKKADETTSDPEKTRLQTPGKVGPNYSQQLDEPLINKEGSMVSITSGINNSKVAVGTRSSSTHSVVRVKSRRDDDSPSPEEPLAPVNERGKAAPFYHTGKSNGS